MNDRTLQLIKECGIRNRLEDIYRYESAKEAMSITLGNTGCDQDSFIGSHILALMESRVPVINMCRKVFEYKLDLLYIANLMGLSLDDLVFLETSGSERLLVRGRDRISFGAAKITAFLVDFSSPDKSLTRYGAFSVDKIVDHRKILEMDTICKEAHCVWVELNVGSCCSLVFHYIKTYHMDKISTSPKRFMFLFLLIIAILTDTSFLTERVHSLDRSAVQEILSFTGEEMRGTQSIYEQVRELQESEEKVDTEIILQMCHKRTAYTDGSGRFFGTSTVHFGYDDWVARDTKKTFLSKIAEFTSNKEYEFLVINSHSHGVREFFIYPPPKIEFVREVLYRNQEIDKREIKNDPELAVYRTDKSFTGKVVIPNILDYLSKAENAKKTGKLYQSVIFIQ
ncbi:exopolyphosphatase [Nematocida minor]|uniref:exopolyphosphatase n=1 Tax=Nematocida minor TaxID=1912983 RepID=UPI00221F9F32|nr:exopolyphosphatase [Nematocida minor]KAI5192540.1 exopolyphosphatase [Nematocida minor]